MNLGLNHLNQNRLDRAENLLKSAADCKHNHPYFKALSSYFIAAINAKNKKWDSAKTAIESAYKFLGISTYESKIKISPNLLVAFQNLSNVIYAKDGLDFGKIRSQAKFDLKYEDNSNDWE